ncbi:MAG: hypothetical protein J7L11_11240 [Thermoprotei archaeon]|nr:hypothetical protein [Thermoprotei archaeon]
MYYEMWDIDKKASMNGVTRDHDGYLLDRETGLAVGRVLTIQMKIR